MRSRGLAHRLVAGLLALLVTLAPALGVTAALALAEEGGAAPAASADVPPALAASRALLVDRTTGLVLLEQNADERACPASITKVMTALLVLESVDDLDEEVTVQESDLERITWEDSVAGLRPGETYTVRDLLACLLIPSGNDASYVLARYVGGGDWHAFVDRMNERAAELGCTGTHFANPCGMDEDGHYTTARDIATFFEAALAHPEFVQIAGSATWDLPATSEQPARTLETTDGLIDPESPVYYPDTIRASKTGTTLNAGRCLVSEATRDGMDLVAVVLGAPLESDASGLNMSFTDMRALLEWGFSAWTSGEVVAKGDVLGSAEVALSDSGETVGVQAAGAISATVPRDVTLDDLTVELSWDGPLTAPLGRGQGLGEATVSLDGRELGTVEVVAASAMGLSLPKLVQSWVSDPVHVAIVVAVAVVVVVVALASSRAASRRRARRRVAAGASRSRARRRPTGRHARRG
ncbi:D-alanyl-D-alanine carboxypeptidase family protein [Thermophilibacter sp.]